MATTVPTLSKSMAVILSQVFMSPGQLTGTEIVGLFKWRVPQSCRIVGVSVESRAKGGTHAATTVTVNVGANVLSTVNITATAAGAREDGAISATYSKAAKDAEVTVDYAETGGTSPTLDGTRVQIDYTPED